MADRIAFADTVGEMARLAVGDPRASDAAVEAHAERVLARLSSALDDDATVGERIGALIEVFMHAALQQLVAAGRAEDRIEFAEAELSASSVAAAMDRAAEAAARGDLDTVSAAMTAAEAVLGADLRFLRGIMF